MQKNTNLNEVIKFIDVGKVYPGAEHPALRDVNFFVRAGEFVCLIGPSGYGKSTILKIIAGIEKETAGTVVRPERVSMVFQTGALFPWLSVFDNVAVGVRAQGAGEAEVRQRVMHHIEMTGLKEFVGKYPRELSGGQRQRVGIARALAVDPTVLLLDEPFSALDPKTTDELHNDIIRIWRETGKTVVMVSHLIEEAVSLADRILLVKNFIVDQVFDITLPRPRREQEAEFMHEVQKIRHEFFK